uniref:Uncharacterized protein n=1 Tax=Peronospora matthiolae TaxID=2874970 RepID=A0AAV1TYQ4_9STRA
MQLDPLPEQVRVTFFMEGVRTGFARTEAFRIHPSTLEEDVDIALNAEFSLKPLAMALMDIPTDHLMGLSPWTSSMLKKKREIFRTLNGNGTSVDVTHAGAPSTCAPSAY